MRRLVLAAAIVILGCGRPSPLAPSPVAGRTLLDVTLHTLSGQPIGGELVRASADAQQRTCETGDDGRCQIELAGAYRGMATLVVSPVWFESTEQTVAIAAEITRVEMRLAPSPPGPLSGPYLMSVEASASCTDWPASLRRASTSLVLWQRGEGWWTEIAGADPACGFYGSARASEVDIHYLADCPQSQDGSVVLDVGDSRRMTMKGVGRGTVTASGIEADMDGVLGVTGSGTVPQGTPSSCSATDHRVTLVRVPGR
jgi:hypothetical protein